jgi:hypothetical protein
MLATDKTHSTVPLAQPGLKISWFRRSALVSLALLVVTFMLAGEGWFDLRHGIGEGKGLR